MAVIFKHSKFILIMKTIKRELLLSEALISGETMRNLIEILPSIKKSFKQRDKFDEYVYFDTQIDLSLDDIIKLNEANFNVDICKDIVVIV
jgi:hypothetical protein